MTKAANFNKAPRVYQENKQENNTTFVDLATEFGKQIPEDIKYYREKIRENISQEEIYKKRRRAVGIIGTTALIGAISAANFISSSSASEATEHETPQNITTTSNQEQIIVDIHNGARVRSDLEFGKLTSEKVLLETNHDTQLSVDPSRIDLVNSKHDGEFIEIQLDDEDKQRIHDADKFFFWESEALSNDEDNKIYISTQRATIQNPPQK